MKKSIIVTSIAMFGIALASEGAAAKAASAATVLSGFNMQTLLQPIVALIAGILVLLVPRILSFVVAIYLIFVGVTGLWPHLLSGLHG